MPASSLGGLNEVALYVSDEAIPDRGAVIGAIAQALARMIPSDLVGWNDVDMLVGRATVHTVPDGSVPDVWAAERLLETAEDHPMVRSYLSTAGDPSPRRMSDLVGERELHRTRAYSEMLRHIGGEHQATVVTTAFLATGGHAWSFSRSSKDFSDADLQRLSDAQPLLAILDRVTQGSGPRPVHATGDRGLTRREAEVLGDVANGLTADAIGVLHGISGRTVRKHLEHAYEKLDAHDKVTAVLRFRGEQPVSLHQR
jgi:DNA-binding CsgD family transcriptional regulator